jgi:hypothetical protein
MVPDHVVAGNRLAVNHDWIYQYAILPFFVRAAPAFQPLFARHRRPEADLRQPETRWQTLKTNRQIDDY